MLFISLVGHLVIFVLFSFSFGKRLPKAEYPNVSFWGQFFKDLNFSKEPVVSVKSRALLKMPSSEAMFSKKDPLFPDDIKPHSVLNSDAKSGFVKSLFTNRHSLRGRKPAIIFYPQLPYTFPLYFQDRQTAHVELLFKIIEPGAQGSVLVKRKISSGNLEADLLTMRYIGRYLSMEQGNFPLDIWQTVKIDLSKEQ